MFADYHLQISPVFPAERAALAGKERYSWEGGACEVGCTTVNEYAAFYGAASGATGLCCGAGMSR